MRTGEIRPKANSARWRAARALLLAIGFSSSVFGAEQEPKPAKPPKPPPPVASKPVNPAANKGANSRPPQNLQQQAMQKQAAQAQAQAVNQQARAAMRALNASNLPAGLNMQKIAQLSRMSPEERSAALSQLKPGMQERIEHSVENFASWPPEEQARALSQYERFSAMPPERKEVVRQSLAELQATVGPRKAVLAGEMIRLSTMSPEMRADFMSKPAFRSQYSAQEIEMMNNLHGVVP